LEKCSGHSSPNCDPTPTVSGVHCKLEEAMIKKKEKSRPKITYEDNIGVVQPPSPPSRHRKWKQARVKRSSAYSYEKSRIVIEKIVSYFLFVIFYGISYMKNLYNFGALQESLFEQSSQVNFVPHTHEDILVAAIGQPEHLDRVCAVRTRVGICQLFRTAPRHSSSFEPSQKVLSKLRQQITEQVT